MVPGTVSLTHCIICDLYESLFVNNERNIGLKIMRLCFHYQYPTLKISDICYCIYGES